MAIKDKFKVVFLDEDGFYGSIFKERLDSDLAIDVVNYNSGLALIEKLHEVPDVLVVNQSIPDVSLRGLSDLVKLYNKDVSIIYLNRSNYMCDAEVVNEYELFAHKSLAKDENTISNLTQLLQIKWLSFSKSIAA